MGNSSSANNSMDQPIVEEEAVDVMSENKNASASTLETEGNADPEETVHNNTESPPESDQNGAQDFDVPNKEENSFKEEEEHIIESESGNCVQTKSDAEAAPFSFSDFARQPNRPDSPNLSEVSDPPEGENREGKKSEESQKQLAQNGSPVMVEVVNEELSEYNATKPNVTLPPATSRRNPFMPQQVVPHGRGPSVDPEIGRQRTESLAKDQEARHKVWNSLVLCLLERFELAADKELQALLPLVFPGISMLTANATDVRVKQKLAKFYSRVAAMYGFSPTQ